METRAPLTNHEVAEHLERVASLLEAQHASPHRVRAWRHAVALVRELDRDVAELVRDEGIAGLDRIAGLGPSLAAAIEEIVRTRRLRFLAHLEGELGHDAIFATIPGVGPALAHRIHETLHVSTLEELEIAAHDGRLEQVQGVGPRRAQSIRDSLEIALRGSARRRATPTEHLPPVALLLAFDARYREQAAAGTLPRIAPRRFNPEHERWLPVMHGDEDGWHLHALFSNTARAHELGRTQDWVIVFAERDGRETQHTVVTETHGALRGYRVVRGRERECEAHYVAMG